jgi:tRNA threonylcarbamoyladenosine biosynthesis protein TsaB
VRLLALDAAGAACSAALWQDGRIACHRRHPMSRGHAEALIPLILEVLGGAGTSFAALSKIAVGVGPGSFTGIRIALAAARGLGLAAGLPVLGVDSFSAVAAVVPEEARRGRSLLVAIDSKREALFGQYFDAELRPSGAALVLPPEALLAQRPPGALLIAGDAAGLIPAAADTRHAHGEHFVDAAAIARLAAADQVTLPPRALYLRAPDVTMP